MKISLDALAVLDAIDRRGSFAAAAVELDRVPSAVTYIVRRLEDDLDVLVFDRRGHRAQLTPAGRELLDAGRLLLRDAGEIEHRVKRVATGWEAELRIAVDNAVPLAVLWPLVAAFYANCRDVHAAHTRLRITTEVFGGTWDALADGRADLAIGASGDPPPGGGYRTRAIAESAPVFAVAPDHPLAAHPEPIPSAAILRHRAVVAADSSRRLPPRTVGLIAGQDTLTVPDLAAKTAAQVAGLGCGFLPAHLAALGDRGGAPRREAGRGAAVAAADQRRVAGRPSRQRACLVDRCRGAFRDRAGARCRRADALGARTGAAPRRGPAPTSPRTIMTQRSRSHHAAHVDNDRQRDVPEMELVHRGGPVMVTTGEELARLVETLRNDGSFAYDSEFITERSYLPQLCLVQVASRSTLALIDPLGTLDMTPFWELLADPSSTKIVHAGDSDIEPVVRHLGRAAAGIFDTQIAAGFVGLPYPMSLKKLVFALTGVELGRDLGFSNWQQRPLSPVQIRYAADDVRYLPAAHKALLARLAAAGNTSRAEEECAAACRIERFGFNRETHYLRVRGGAALSPRAQAALKELTHGATAQRAGRTSRRAPSSRTT